jgi:cytoskeletal protein CcmA (bactofilin family)
MVQELEPSRPTATASPARRFTDSVDKPATVIGPRTRIKGELSGSDPVDLAGTLEGDSRVRAHYRVRPGGKVVGEIEAASLVVEGEVLARDLTADKIEIGASARVLANLRARLVAIAEGAFFDGEVHMQGAEAGSGPVSFKDQRKSQGPADADPPRS